jgi:hypothetical protein
MQHTQECLEAQAENERLRAAWASAWPDHCRHCEGQGQFESYFDPSPVGLSLGSGYYLDVEPCEQCTAVGKCARCGQQTWTTEDLEQLELANDTSVMSPCSFCGWNWDRGKDDSMPPYEECACYEIGTQLWEESQREQDYYHRLLRGEE